MNKLILATNNKNKLREITELLHQFGLDLIVEPIGAYTTVEPDETGGSYLANATIKAQSAAALTGLPCLAEDSGIEIAALDSAPGVDTAPWVASLGGWEAAMALVQKKVAEGASTQIDFHSTFVLAWPDGTVLNATACCAGAFTWPARGVEGFGHDAYFVPGQAPEGFNYFIPYTENSTEGRTYAEMGLAEKQKISPRAHALAILVDKIKIHDGTNRPCSPAQQQS